MSSHSQSCNRNLGGHTGQDFLFLVDWVLHTFVSMRLDTCAGRLCACCALLLFCGDVSDSAFFCVGAGTGTVAMAATADGKWQQLLEVMLQDLG